MPSHSQTASNGRARGFHASIQRLASRHHSRRLQRPITMARRSVPSRWVGARITITRKGRRVPDGMRLLTIHAPYGTLLGRMRLAQHLALL